MLIGATLFFALSGTLAWRRILKNRFVVHHSANFFGLHFSRDPITVAGLGFAIYLLAAIVLRSRLRVDRYVAGLHIGTNGFGIVSRIRTAK